MSFYRHRYVNISCIIYISLSNISECGQTLQDERGSFSSPPLKKDILNLDDKNHVIPDNSATEQLCQWRISATHGEKIVLNLTLLDIPDSPNCASDYLMVRDGHWLKSPLLGKTMSIFLKEGCVLFAGL